MKKSLQGILLLVIFFNMVFFSNTFAYKKVKTFIIKAPEKVMIGVKRIAILDFKTEGANEADKRINSKEKLIYQIFSDLKDYDKSSANNLDYGRRFSDMLISDLLKSDRGITDISTGFLGLGKGKEGKSLLGGTYTNVYEVLERTQLMQIIEEKKLSASGMISDDQTIELGGMLGVQAIVMGDVYYSHKDTDYKQSREKKKDGKKIKYKVNCQKREIKVNVRARIVNSETGQIIGSTEASKSLSKNKCDDSWGSLPSVDEMINEGLKELVPKIANYFSPHFELQSNELEKITIKQFKKKADKAAKLAEDLEIDEAYYIYNSIYEKDAYNPKVLYNLGLMNEVVGNFENAKEFYEMALQLKDKKKYKKAVKRVAKNVQFSDALAQMGIEIAKHEFALSEDKKTEITAKKVEIKGKRDQRIKIYAQPDKSSEVVARVPGGVKFSILKRQGDWFEIKLMGGKQGYVHKEKALVKD